MKLLRDQVQWGRTTINYSYEYKDRKTLTINVHPDLSVSVQAPRNTTSEEIRQKIVKRANWIRKSQREFELYLPKQPPRQYVGRESHKYLGRQYRLKIRKGKTDGVKFSRGYFFVTTKHKPTPEIVKTLLDKWYLEKARIIFEKRFRACKRIAQSYGIDATNYSIRKLSTRWGSCTKAGKIILNIELIKAPTECIDYVIMHELCHLKEHNHGSRYWSLLRKMMPDYEIKKRRLNLIENIGYL